MSKDKPEPPPSLPRFGPLERFDPHIGAAGRWTLERGLRELRGRNRCDFCAALPVEFGVHLPGTELSRRVMAPRGNRMMLPYSLRGGCFGEPGVWDRYEAHLWGDAPFLAGRRSLD